MSDIIITEGGGAVEGSR